MSYTLTGCVHVHSAAGLTVYCVCADVRNSAIVVNFSILLHVCVSGFLCRLYMFSCLSGELGATNSCGASPALLRFKFAAASSGQNISATPGHPCKLMLIQYTAYEEYDPDIDVS